ncbi:DUF4386 domain-containing protein [Ornithinibacillus salinisoli]|uniref:DUF4386 domain-containing protein n=1 Tax=Ornithinibacillus salinisoli TaxID=1848459 RepID=A0ABW4W7S0_9BACI
MLVPNNKLTDQRKIAVITGISLLIMAIAASFSAGFVHESILVEGDANATLNNMMTSQTLFKVGIFGWLIILLTDIVVAWGFYIFLKPFNKYLSLLGAWFRLIYTSILAIAILNLIVVLLLTKSTDYISLLSNEQLALIVMLLLNAFNAIWNMGLIIFGGHLLIVGYIAFTSSNLPKIISILLLVASFGYIVIHLCITFLPQYERIITILENVFTLPMIVGELGFGIWLLFKGGKSLSDEISA